MHQVMLFCTCTLSCMISMEIMLHKSEFNSFSLLIGGNRCVSPPPLNPLVIFVAEVTADLNFHTDEKIGLLPKKKSNCDTAVFNKIISARSPIILLEFYMLHNAILVTPTSEIMRIRISQLPIPLQQAVSVIELGVVTNTST
jgi:hypothetical protein